MPRPPRVQFPGAIYHVTARGNARQSLFLDDRDREHFLLRLREAVDAYQVRLYLFCLMTNHIHLLVETPAGNLSRFMQPLLTSHVTYFNRRHERVGHLFQGRFGARLVSRDEYLLRLTRYVHLNPAFTDASKRLPLVERIAVARRYPWSSYLGYIDRTKRLRFVDYEPVLELITGGRRDAERLYRAYVEEGLAQTDKEFDELIRSTAPTIGRVQLPKAESREQSGKASGRRTRRADEFAERLEPIEPERVLSVVAKAFGQSVDRLRQRQRGNVARAAAAMMLCRHAGDTQRQAAERLGLTSGAAVSIQLRRLRGVVEKDRKLRETIAALQARLLSKI